tara:strand:- start:16 stop:516 length:501 start_codon:yes stop_codon:yes gene_type:complete
MNQIKRIIFWTAVVFIGIWLIMPVLRWIMDLEFATDSIKSNYKEFLFFAIPIAILLTLFGTINDKDKGSKIAGKVIGTSIAAAVTVFIMFMSIFTDMCVWTNRQVLYENKNDSNTKIIVRDFGCGATDSGPPTVGIYKVRYFTDYFIRSTKIDTAKIDKNEWIKIE